MFNVKLMTMVVCLYMIYVITDIQHRRVSS